MTIRNAIKQYQAYRVSLGGKFRTGSFILKAFSNTIGDETEISDISSTQCINYLNIKGYVSGRITAYWFCIHSELKGLFEWCHQRDLLSAIPLPKILPRKPEAFIPFIYTKEQLVRIFDCALHYRKRFNIFYPEVIQCMLRTMYFLGLRPSEAVHLTLSDIHLDGENYAIIQESKFYKSRIVPFNAKVATMFESFLHWRHLTGLPEDDERPLFLDKKGNAMKLSGIQGAFRLICDMADVRRDTTFSHSDVRLQDLRHTFATHRMLAWYRQGKNVQNMLPLLSAYLGHEHLDSTAVYISFIPELMAEAGDLFYRYHMKGGSDE